MTTQQAPVRVSLSALQKHVNRPAPMGLEGEHVRLRVTLPEDHAAMYAKEVLGPNAWRWRFRGQPVSFAQYEEMVSKVWEQYIVQDVATGRDLGIVMAYMYAPTDRHCEMAAFRLDEDKQVKDLVPDIPVAASPMMQGMALFFQHLFETYGLQKIYLRVGEFNVEQIEGGLTHFCAHEGRKEKHVFANGRWYFEDTYALYADAFQEPWIQDAIRRATDIGKLRLK